MPASVPATIDSFRGIFGFLSNFHEASIWLGGERYPSVEHAYQASKSRDPSAKRLIREAKSPGVAKRLGQALQLPDDWEDQKIEVMRRLVALKFENPLLRAMLLATEDAVIVEGNSWNDTFWGVCKGSGQNWLGRILMETRDDIRKEEP